MRDKVPKSKIHQIDGLSKALSDLANIPEQTKITTPDFYVMRPNILSSEYNAMTGDITILDLLILSNSDRLSMLGADNGASLAIGINLKSLDPGMVLDEWAVGPSQDIEVNVALMKVEAQFISNGSVALKQSPGVTGPLYHTAVGDNDLERLVYLDAEGNVRVFIEFSRDDGDSPTQIILDEYRLVYRAEGSVTDLSPSTIPTVSVEYYDSLSVEPPHFMPSELSIIGAPRPISTIDDMFRPLSGRLTIGDTGWIASGNADLPLKRDVIISGVTTADKAIIDFVLASLPIATDAGMTYQETYDGGVTLYATAPPTSVTFDYTIIRG
jgi:hypothetical protein